MNAQEKLEHIKGLNEKEKEAEKGINLSQNEEINKELNKYLEGYSSDEHFESFMKSKTSRLDEDMLKTLFAFIHSPTANAYISRHLEANGVKNLGKTPESRASQLFLLRQKRKGDFVESKMKKFVGSQEQFESFQASESFEEQFEAYENFKEDEIQSFTGKENEQFESFVPLIGIASSLAKKGIKGIGKLVASKKAKAQSQKDAGDEATKRATVETAKAQALNNGVPVDIVNQITSRITKDSAGRSRSNMAILNKAIEKIPERQLQELKDMKAMFIQKETNEQIKAQAPIIIIAIVVLVGLFFLVKKS